MLEDLVDDQDVEARPLIGIIGLGSSQDRKAFHGDKNFSMSCELGVCYPTLKAMLNREDLHLRVGISLLFIFLAYAMSHYKRNLGIQQIVILAYNKRNLGI
jgi:hypothetical protein